MKVLLINGSPHKEGCTFTALSEVANTLNKNDIETEIYHIGTKPIVGCIACMKCWKSKHCIFKDDVNKIGARLDEFDGVILGSPVYYAGPTGQLCCFCDRLFYAHGKKFIGKLGAAVVSCRRAGGTASFDRLNRYFTINKMHVVGSQYWNIVHGHTPDDVKKDKEGLQTMRTLGQSMAWLLKCIEIGKKNGINKPEYEPTTFTSFPDGK